MKTNFRGNFISHLAFNSISCNFTAQKLTPKQFAVAKAFSEGV
jgi:hypothetical protein